LIGQSTLAGRIGGLWHAAEAHHSDNRCNVGDGTRPLLQQERRHKVRQREWAHQVDFQDPAKVCRRLVLRGNDIAYAGIIDENVDSPVAFECCLNESFAL
jgi:hypothetical protein